MATKIFNLQDLGKSIRHERKARGLSQEDLAMRAMVSRQTIIKIEGSGDVGAATLIRTLAAMGCVLSVQVNRPDYSELSAMMDE